jgi:CheY-like chemotaxis protein
MIAETDAIRVLVVEDKPTWANPLARMYKSILGAECIVDVSDDPNDAIRRLRTGSYHLLSLDINMGDRKDIGADGLDVFDKAVESAPPLVNGIIVVTGAPYDKMLKRSIPDAGRRKIVQIELQTYFDKWFTQRVRLFHKHPDWSVEAVIASIIKSLPQKALVALGESQEAYIFDSPDDHDDRPETVGTAGTVIRILDKKTYRPTPGTYKLLKILYALQKERGCPISNEDLYKAVYPGSKEDRKENYSAYITERCRSNDEDIRLRRDIVTRDKGRISLRIP